MFTEQVVRPTGLIDPLCQVKPVETQVDDLLAEVKEDIPDARAAARVIAALDELLLAIKLDPEPLLKEAKELEAQPETPRYIG